MTQATSAPTPPAARGQPVLAVHDTCSDARTAWHALEADGYLASPFQCFAWLSSWQDITGPAKSSQPLVVVVSGQDGAAWMLLPLCLQRHRGARVLSWMGGGVSGYHGPVVGKACPPRLLGPGFPALWTRVLAALPPVDCVHLQRQPPTIGPYDNPWLGLGPSTSHQVSPRTRLSLDWAAEYGRHVSSKGRGKDRRKLRRLEEHGPVELVIATDPSTKDEIIDALIAQKSRWLRQQGVADMFAQAENVAFLRQTARHHPDRIHVSCIRVDGRILATHWGLLQGGTFCYWFQSHDDGDLARLSPSELLIRRLMSWCCDNGVHTFDFGMGDHAYKLRWADEQVPLHECWVPRSPRGRALVAGGQVEAWLRRQVKASPRLLPLAVQWRSRLHQLRRGLGAQG